MERDRGDIGMLAIAVAACAGSDTDADTDEIASAIMIDAGAELARWPMPCLRATVCDPLWLQVAPRNCID